MNFTELVENYNNKGLKGLVEELDQEEFDKCYDKAVDKATGKIRNKHIVTPTVIATKDQKEIEKEEDK